MLLDEDVTDPTIRRVETAKEEDYRRRVRQQGLELLPGVSSWIARPAPAVNVDLVLDVTGTRAYFDAVVTGGDVAKGKPNRRCNFAAGGQAWRPHRTLRRGGGRAGSHPRLG
ncbi:MAG TPA: hypothetical protein VMW62_03660 [Chloroflexota bacterium]|nr:hypothetical protein [Chloroflexota bacterium]